METNDGKQARGAYIPRELLEEISRAGSRLLIGMPRERVGGERRLALTPEAVEMLTARGHRVLGRPDPDRGARPRFRPGQARL